MAFKGTLKEFKVPDILQLISLQKKTGILTFTSSDRFITLIFEKGLIAGVDAFPKKLEMRVGNVLVKRDFISEEMLQRALAIQKRTNQKIGEILIGMGLVDQKTIQTALETQAVEIVLSLFKWKKGEYNFKIMESLDKNVKAIDPIPTDNIIMEGVQMLDEWPMIKKYIPTDSLVFEPAQIETKKIEIVDEYEDEKENSDKIYLTETETSLLKYVNGQNSVKELVEMGVFTEYRLYKSLYKLVKNNVIKPKEKSKSGETEMNRLVEEIKIQIQKQTNLVFAIVLIILMLILAITFIQPLRPISSKNVIVRDAVIKNLKGL
jgi:hypothetical protein